MLHLLRPDGMIDPGQAAHTGPIVAWARVAWLGRIPHTLLRTALDWAADRCSQREDPWRYVTGPAQAYVLTLLRLGWIPVSPTSVMTDDGKTIDYTEVPPTIVGQEVCRAVDRWSWRTVSHKYGWQVRGQAVNLKGIRRLLGKNSSYPASLKSSLASIVTLAIPTTAQARQMHAARTEKGGCGFRKSNPLPKSSTENEAAQSERPAVGSTRQSRVKMRRQI